MTIAAAKITTDDVLDQTWNTYIETRAPEAEAALVAHYISLANYLARSAIQRAPAWQDPDDLRSYAYVGLLQAVRRFEPNQGAKFETFATRRISGNILDGQRKDDSLIRSARARVKRYTAAKSAFIDQHRRQPTDQELAAAIGESVDGVRELHVMHQTVDGSLDEAIDEGLDPREPTAVHDQADIIVLDEIADLLSRKIARTAASMPTLERTFMLMHWCEGRSLRSIAGHLGLSPSWCNKVKQEVLFSLTQSA